MSASTKKVSKKKVTKKKVSKKEVETRKGPDNTEEGMAELAKTLKKGAKKVSKKKVAKKKAAGKVTKSAAQIKREKKAADKKVEQKIVGKVVVGKRQMLMLNPKNIVIVDGFNPRIDKGDIAELMKSIKENGVKTPIRVYKVGKHFELIDGERRLLAALKLGLKDIPAIEERGKKTEEELLKLALISNDGKPFAPVEEADAYRRLINAGWTARQISVATGKSLQLVKNRLELISAHPDVAAAVKKGKLSVNMGIAIAKKVKGRKAQKRVVKKAVKSKAGRKKVADAIGKANIKTKFENKAVALQNRLNKLVVMVNKRRKGKEKIPTTMSKQILHFSQHKDKEVRAAYVAGGCLAISEVMGKVNTRAKKKKKGLTARGKQKR